ncbi:MAG TPA: YdeI/OmpD-associated family protein [Pseudonocardia sp.]|nr:YdeI/OmpD-associated family protein [Pseudonocardia sp.]
MSADGERFEPADLAAWRAWLGDNHRRAAGVWLVTWRARTGRTQFSYDEAVEQALCFGWVDSKPRALDDDRTMLWFAPRKRGSGWSRPNKQRVERLLAAGLMAPAGLAAVETAKADGSWTMLDAVEDLVVPDDLAAAFEARPGAREQWEAFPRSVKRGILEWIVQAKRPGTRAKRVTETADKAAVGERANQWRPRS